MDMFGMMGDMMENMVRDSAGRSEFNCISPPFLTFLSFLQGEDVRFTQLSDLLLVNSHLLLFHRRWGS